MGAVEILMLWVVGFCVLVFLVVDYLDFVRKSRKGCQEAGDQKKCLVYDSERKTAIGQRLSESVEKAEKQFSSDSPDLVNSDNQGCCKKSGTCNEDTFDDWEGIERTELERLFGKAVVFVSEKKNAGKIAGALKLELFALQKVALEGPCHGSEFRRAFKVSSRAKWSAWQKLGNMSPEMAMEKYVNNLAKAFPGWKDEGTEALS